VESSCELGNEPSGSIKCWELPSGCTTCGLSSGTQLHRVSYVGSHFPSDEGGHRPATYAATFQLQNLK
jgi:hypothetical protein